MNRIQPSHSQNIAIDWRQQEASSLVLPKPPILSSKSKISQEIGLGFNCYSQPPHEFPESSSLQHLIVVSFEGGRVERKMHGKKQIESLDKGSAVLIPARVNHTGVAYDSALFALLMIEPKFLANHVREVINPDNFELIPTFAKPDSLIYGITKSIKADFDSGNYDISYIETLFGALSAHLLKHYATQKVVFKEYSGGLPPYKLKQALNYINDNLDQPIKLKNIAQLLDISQYYFCHLFKESTGIAPYKYIIRQRVEKAKDLIRQSKIPLADIAYECGFSSQSQMTQHFRKCVGVTPKVYFLKIQ